MTNNAAVNIGDSLQQGFNDKGLSLAKGPAGLIGAAALAYGITALIFGDRSFASEPLSGTVNGGTWLGLEVNGWTSLLFIAGGALLLFGAPLHWGAKTVALLVGLAFGAASVMMLIDGDDAFGIFAGNGLTALVLGVAAAVLLVVALLPRVGGMRHDDTRAHVDERTVVERDVPRKPVVEREVRREPVAEREARFTPETRPAGDRAGSRAAGDGDVVAPASGSTPEP